MDQKLLSSICIAGFQALTALSTTEGQLVLLFHFDRDRITALSWRKVLVLVLEVWNTLKNDGATILAEVVGYGSL